MLRNKEQITEEDNMRNRIMTILLAAIMTISLAGCGTSGKEEKVGSREVDGTYQMEVATENADSTILSYQFDKEAGTFSETVAVGDKSYELAAGTYQLDEEANLIHTVTEKGASQDFVIDGEYLIADGYFYEGEIPEGESFDATLKYTGEGGTTSVVVFNKDGTYTFTGSMKSVGTYKRRDSLIEMDSTDGSTLVNFLIYQGQISNSYLKKLP